MENLNIREQLAGLSPAKRALLELKLLKKKGRSGVAEPVILRRPAGNTAPLSYNQQGLWVLSQLMPGVSLYHIPKAVRLTGNLNVAALKQTLDFIVARHESVRTSFVTADGVPMQVISPAAPLEMPFRDLSDLPEADRETEAQRVIDVEARRLFDLSQAPLIRAILLKLRDKEHILLVTTHHIVTDGWSMGIFHNELMELYKAFSAGQPSLLPELPIQYADYAVWHRQWFEGLVYESQLSYWKEQFKTLPPVLELPGDHPRAAVQAFRAFRGDQQSLRLSKNLTRQLKEFCQQEEATPFMLLLAVYYILLQRYTGEEDIVVGSPIAGRCLAETESLIGLFINVLALRANLSGNPTFRELLHRVKDVAFGAFAHQDLPFETLVKEVQPDRTLSHNPLFQVMFVLQNEPIPPLEFGGLAVEHVQANNVTTNFDLTLDIVERDGQFICKFECNADLFEAETITRMMAHFETLLKGAVANPNRKIGELPLIGEAERDKLLIEWNQTARDFPRNNCAPQLFEEQVDRTPNATAVVFEDQRLTYAELNARANQLARYLRASGVGPDSLVGISIERSLDLAIGILGIMKSGAAYVPFDPVFPKDRLAFMFADTDVPVLLTSGRLAASLPASQARIVCMDSDWREIARQSDENLGAIASPDNLVYVIYTSGSTGRPKGVRSNHRGLTNILYSLQREPGVNADDTVLSVTTLSFDIFSQDLLLPLMSGGRLVIVSSEVGADGNRLRLAMEKYRPTVMQATPTTWTMLIEAGWPGHDRLKIFCGAEVLTRELADQLLERSGEVWNLYGPTESSIWTTVGKVERGQGPISIGRPVSNTQVYLLDKNLNPAPIGVPAELHVGSIGIARGYLNRPELTSEKFIPNPFSSDPRARLYKTGDLARYLSDGKLFCLGRMDDQVKIRGFRIELGEIESVLRQHPHVRQCVVVAREDSPGDRRLVAYVVPVKEATVDAKEIRAFLQKQLPEFMVPAVIVELGALPLTPTMKVNRRALPPPVHNSQANAGYVAPRTAVEEKLAKIWADVLKVESPGANDNFFELGGHSLLAVRLFARIENAFGKQLPLATLFQASTIAKLAEVLGKEEWAAPWSSLVAIQPKGSRRPFFCVHAAGGNVVELHQVARHLDTDQPFYAFQSRGLDGQQEPLTDIKDMAAHYLSEMRQVQPRGPYLLGGRSFGGLVAFEMACQLRDQGAQVGLLALFDTYPMGHFKLRPEGNTRAFRRRRFARKMRSHVDNLRRLGFREKAGYLFDKLQYAPAKTKHQLWRALVRGFEWLHRPLPAKLKIIQQLNFLAARNFIPRVYHGQVALFSATGDLTTAYDLREGWQTLAPNGVEVHEIPGDHINIIKEPHVRALAEKLSECLTKAQREDRTAVCAA